MLCVVFSCRSLILWLWNLWLILMDSLLLNFLFYLCIVFLILLNCLFFLVAHCLLKTAFLNYLSSALESYHLSLSLGSVIRRLLWPFGGVIFPWLVMFHEVYISVFIFEVAVPSSSLYWLQIEIPPIIFVRDSEVFSELFSWICLLHISCSFLTRNFLRLYAFLF